MQKPYKGPEKREGWVDPAILQETLNTISDRTSSIPYIKEKVDDLSEKWKHHSGEGEKTTHAALIRADAENVKATSVVDNRVTRIYGWGAGVLFVIGIAVAIYEIVMG